MQPRRYLILDLTRSEGVGRARDKRLGQRSPEPRLSDRLSVDSLEPGDAAQVAEQPERLVAEVLPTRLVSPVVRSIIGAPASSGTTWGIEAIGANVSPLSGLGVTAAVLDTGIDEAHEAFAHLQICREDFLGATRETMLVMALTVPEQSLEARSTAAGWAWLRHLRVASGQGSRRNRRHNRGACERPHLGQGVGRRGRVYVAWDRLPGRLSRSS
jgi:hypothetical protein